LFLLISGRNLKQLEVDYDSVVIPRPKHWGGFLVVPVEIEFWQGRPNRCMTEFDIQVKRFILENRSPLS
jgi:pyridoxine/pyridoxamine 5'-phosphate oxidase